MELKLNLGCGKVYKPGFVNVDASPTSVADKNWDIMDLPMKDASVDLIEMDQVIEHFDWINVRYLLAECWRVLKPGGKLALETPDLMGTMKKLKKAQGEEFLVASQWLFGIGTKGQRHGMVFKEKELQSLLMTSGFIDVVSRPQQTYAGEPGMRMECRRGVTEGRKKVEALFRKRVRKVFRGDSYVLIPVEDLVKDLYFSLTIDGEPREPIFTENIYRSAVVDPEVPGQLLLSMKAYRRGLDMADDLLETLRAVNELEIVSKGFTLWMKRRKGADVRRSFRKFSEDLAWRLSVSMSGQRGSLSDMEYLLSLDPTPIRMLDFRMISDRALEWVSEGIRLFHQGEREKAIEKLEMSISAIPVNPTAHWNLARLNYIEGRRSESIKMMDRTIKLLSDRYSSKEARKEQEMMRKGLLDVNDIVPKDHIHV